MSTTVSESYVNEEYVTALLDSKDDNIEGLLQNPTPDPEPESPIVTTTQEEIDSLLKDFQITSIELDQIQKQKITLTKEYLSTNHDRFKTIDTLAVSGSSSEKILLLAAYIHQNKLLPHESSTEGYCEIAKNPIHFAAKALMIARIIFPKLSNYNTESIRKEVNALIVQGLKFSHYQLLSRQYALAFHQDPNRVIEQGAQKIVEVINPTKNSVALLLRKIDTTNNDQSDDLSKLINNENALEKARCSILRNILGQDYNNNSLEELTSQFLKSKDSNIKKILERFCKIAKIDPENFKKLENIEATDYIRQNFDLLIRATNKKINTKSYQAAKKIVKERLPAGLLHIENFEFEKNLMEALSNVSGLPLPKYFTCKLPANYQIAEFINGQSLDEYLKDNPDLNTKINVFQNILAALNKIHQIGIVHRDLKPDNILITPEGEAKLIDFGSASTEGVARSLSFPQNPYDAAPIRNTRAIHTAEYAAPEQKKLFSNVKARADLYSMGVIFYKILTGNFPNANNYQPISEDIIPNKPSFLRDLDKILRKLLRKNQWLRYQSAQSVLKDLEALQSKYSIN